MRAWELRSTESLKFPSPILKKGMPQSRERAISGGTYFLVPGAERLFLNALSVWEFQKKITGYFLVPCGGGRGGRGEGSGEGDPPPSRGLYLNSSPLVFARKSAISRKSALFRLGNSISGPIAQKLTKPMLF